MLVLHSHQIHIKSLRQKQLRPSCLYCQSFEIILVSPLTNRIIHQRNHIVRKSCAPQVLQNSAFQICHELHHHPLPHAGVFVHLRMISFPFLRWVILLLKGERKKISNVCSINKRGEAFFAEGFLYGYHCFF